MAKHIKKQPTKPDTAGTQVTSHCSVGTAPIRLQDSPAERKAKGRLSTYEQEGRVAACLICRRKE